MKDPTPTRMTATEVARQAAISAHAVRYYARLGLVRPAQDPLNKYHWYDESDLRVLRFIGQAKQLGFALSEIALILDMSRRGDSPCPTVRQLAAMRLAQFHDQVRRLQATRRHLRRALALWSQMPDSVPGSERICALIESAGDIHDPKRCACP